MQNLNSQIMKFMHDPSTITVKLQKFIPLIKLFCKDLQNCSPQNIHAIQYYISGFPFWYSAQVLVCRFLKLL